jgi:hypothetical protein
MYQMNELTEALCFAAQRTFFSYDFQGNNEHGLCSVGGQN